MATLSADEITAYRQLTGDEEATVDFDNATIQALYDRAYAYDLDAGTTEAITVVFILRRKLGMARHKVDIGAAEFEIEKRSQYFKNTMEMLKYWEGIATAGGFDGGDLGRISSGTIDLGLDQDEVTA